MKDNPYEEYDREPTPYRPAHPIREGFTMGVFTTVVVVAVIWILWRVV